jgi:DNA-binding transcriptional MerR regulator
MGGDRKMRMGELSRRSAVPVPTIKYYLREGLLARGAATAANQADYSEEHLRRLRLIRALIDVGGVSVAGAREVIAALGDDEATPFELLGAAQEAIAPRNRPGREAPPWAAARDRVLALVESRGWLVYTESDTVALVADALAACATLGATELADNLGGYADAAATLAEMEVESVLARPAGAEQMELVVLGTVLGEALFSALRMLLHEHESARRLSVPRPYRPA